MQAYRIINDLRNALDQVACDAALASGVPNVGNIYFPFGKTASDVDNRIASKCVGMHADLQARLRTFNPYLAGDPLLYELSRMANPNKHQCILGMAVADTGLIFAPLPGDFADGPISFGGGKWNEFRNEIEVARIGPNTNAKISHGSLTVPLKLVLGDGVAPLADPAPTVLGILASKTEGIVMALESESRRLGLVS